MATISGEVRDDAGDLVADVVVRAYRRDTGALLVADVSGDGSTPEPGDDDYESVSLLLHCDGANDSTTFTDNSPTPQTVVANGGACIKTAQSKYGGASAFFSSASNGSENLTVAGSAGSLSSVTDFTIEANVYITDWNTESCYLSYGSGSSNRQWLVTINTTRLQFYWSDSNSQEHFINCTYSLSLNTWYHLAFVKSGTTVTCYVNGESIGSGTVSSLRTCTGPLYVASFWGYVGTSTYFRGYIDEIRITKGVARYTANFTPPSAAFLNSADLPAKPLGEYTLTTDYTDEVQVIALDPAGGTTFNDLILRTTPV